MPTVDGDATVEIPETLGTRYQILGILGAGGMGTVYRARDLELDEPVALKILLPELCRDVAMLARFREETKLARRVTHRNVVRVFDIGDHEGSRFITMELVSGMSLAHRIAGDKRLDVEAATGIALQIADGLAAAHAAGVVHRDLKPENVLCARDGRIVVSDFGIAKALEGNVRSNALVGTPLYIAPEQLETPADVDTRADVFSFGVVLFEMLTGRLPWEAPTALAAATARLLRPPTDPRDHAPHLPDALAQLVLDCLARRPDDRVPTIEMAAMRLGAIGRSSRVPPAPSSSPASLESSTIVAVLELRHSGAESDGYLAEATTRELAAQLSRVAGLRARVALWPSGATRNARAIGRALGAHAVLDGRVETDGDAIRLDLRLASVRDELLLWSEALEGKRGDLETLISNATRAAARALTLETPAAYPRIADPEALDMYLRGRHGYLKFWTAREGARLLEHALARCPDDPRILAACSLALGRELGPEIDTSESRPRATALARRAVEIAPDMPEPHVAQAAVDLHEGRPEAAARSLKKALALDETNADALEHACRVLLETDAPDYGRELGERAIEAEPRLRATLPFLFARADALDGDFRAVDHCFHTPPRAGSASEIATYWLTRARIALWRQGTDEPGRVVEGLTKESAPGAIFAREIALAARDGTLTPFAEQMLRDMLTKTLSVRMQCFFRQFAIELHMRCGAHDAIVYEHLERAVHLGLFDAHWVMRCPLLDPLRGTERFEAARRAVEARGVSVRRALLGTYEPA
jgi:TolB-like protein